MEAYKILHFTPVRKKNDIVQLHLQSLKDLNTTDFRITYSFFDDNIDELSSRQLENFDSKMKNTILFFPNDINISDNIMSTNQRWTTGLYERITVIKNFVIDFFLKGDYDYLFLTDSDLILHPETLQVLLKQKKDFCSEIFWTKFDLSNVYTPNSWYSKPFGFSKEDLINFKRKGTYKVDYTGACTLLSRRILRDNVSFKKIPNIIYLGEDKHFCIRANVMEYDIFINTEFPAFHVYDDSLIDQGKDFISSGYDLQYLESWLDNCWEKKLDLEFKVKKGNLFFKVVRKIKAFLVHNFRK